ncbi:MAG: GIY-YIG nuclease family protein, partial [Lachnospiraceae bacterium]|nr:GIY-YIG nuclease family protein [Lachnospiraceae bacterium]
RPVTLVYYEEFETKQEAMSREWHIKQLTRKQKEELVFNSQVSNNNEIIKM